MIRIFFVFTLLLHFSQGAAVLDNQPITFQINGPTTYIPDAGGLSKNGYLMTMGFVGKSWIAAEFVTTTTNTDVLVLQINDFYKSNANPLFAGHQITIGDYFKNSSGLFIDKNTQNDLSSFSFSNIKNYKLELTRYLGSNSGEDWDAGVNKYSLLKVCFYTSSYSFNASTYSNYLSVCYNYEIDALVSTFIGPILKSFIFNGYNTTIYGWIDGPVLTNNLYFYQTVPLFTYSQVPALAIEIGTTAGNLGQDYYVASPTGTESGDYFGPTITSIAQDNTANGFINPALTLKHWNAIPAQQIAGLSTTSLRITFSRRINTFDSYDKTMLSTFIFCMYLYTQGSITTAVNDKTCEIVELSINFVQKSYLVGTSDGPNATYILLYALVFLLMLILT